MGPLDEGKEGCPPCLFSHVQMTRLFKERIIILNYYNQETEFLRYEIQFIIKKKKKKQERDMRFSRNDDRVL